MTNHGASQISQATLSNKLLKSLNILQSSDNEEALEDYNNYKILRTITANRNGDCVGYYKMTSSFYTKKYDLYCKRLEDGRNDTTTIEVDWGVNFDR